MLSRPEFIRLLQEAYPEITPMVERNFSLPQIVYATAVELFRRGEVTTPAAIAIREQLLLQDKVGMFMFAEES